MGRAIEFSIQQRGLQDLGLLLKAEEDGKILRLELQRGLKAAVAPAVAEIKSGALSIKREMSVAKPVSKYRGPESDVSIGAAIAKGVSTSVRLTGRTTGVSVKASKRGMPRKFLNAPKRFNAPKFRHRIFGHGWTDQVGAPGYFDRPLQSHKGEYRVAIITVMDAMAARLASRSAT